MAVTKSELSWVTVSDFKKAKTFFTETLGLKLGAESEEFGWAEFVGEEGGARLGIAKTSEQSPIASGANAVMTFTVKDIEKSKADLDLKGVQLIGEIMEVPGHVKLQLFTDSDGNHFQLVQVL